MRILMLCSSPPGSGGGISRYEADLVEAIGKVSEVNLAAVYVKRQRFWRLSFSLRSLIGIWKHRTDWVFCGHIQFLPLAWLWAKLFGVKVWLQLHGIEAWDRPNRWRLKMIPSVDLVTCVSRYTRDRFLHWSRLPGYKVKVLPNTVSAPGEMISKRDFGGHYPVLTTISRLDKRERYKGHREVIAALPTILEHKPSTLYVVVGDGDDLPHLKRYAQQVGVGEHVLFLGEVNDEERDQIYQGGDLFVMPSRGEGFGIVFLEAMSHGCQVLGLASDGSVDPLQNGALGHVAEASTLARDILIALDNPVENLEARVLATFGADLFQRHVHDLIQRVR